jgi:hypothetical protein
MVTAVDCASTAIPAQQVKTIKKSALIFMNSFL